PDGTADWVGDSECQARAHESVLGERALELLHHGTLDPDFRVAPVVSLAPVASPLPAAARSARDTDEAVRDEDATVIAVVDLVDGEGAQRTEALHLAARVDHALAIVRGHGQGAHRVEQDVDGQALPAALCQGVGDVLRRLALLPHVLSVVDGLPRRLDDAELGGEDLVAVEEHLDAIASPHPAAR